MGPTLSCPDCGRLTDECICDREDELEVPQWDQEDDYGDGD